MSDDWNPELNKMADAIEFKNPFTLEGTQSATPDPQDGKTPQPVAPNQQPEQNAPPGQQNGEGAGKGFTPDQAMFGMALLGGQAGQQNGLDMGAIKDKVGEAWEKMKENKVQTAFQLGGVAKAADTYGKWYKAATTQPTDASPLGVKIIDTKDEVEWRSRSPQEVEQGVGSVALATAIPTAIQTQNIGSGSTAGWVAGEVLARPLLERTETPKNLYIRRGDIQKFEQGLADYGKAAESFRDENNKPYWD
ncbi:hypothetical protein [Fundidesulfovibrio soli]|uniref:hypothetical protein n=1 Tax=Fundidesulfovibrio soli TaxID=2922716 RepID=UPI001FAEC897|nr:hypothetical protein [Fundidesulfovibrio soli]